MLPCNHLLHAIETATYGSEDQRVAKAFEDEKKRRRGLYATKMSSSSRSETSIMRLPGSCIKLTAIARERHGVHLFQFVLKCCVGSFSRLTFTRNRGFYPRSQLLKTVANRAMRFSNTSRPATHIHDGCKVQTFVFLLLQSDVCVIC